MGNAIAKLLESEKEYILDEYDKKCSEISDIENELKGNISFDEAFSRIKSALHDTIPENVCHQLVKEFKEFNGYCSVDISTNIGKDVYISKPMLIIKFPHYSIAFSLMADDDEILVRFTSADLTFERWVKEMMICEKSEFDDYEVFKTHQYSSLAYYEYCKELSKLEEFAKAPSFKNYCIMCDIDYSPLAIVNKETFSAYRSKIETCVSDKGWLVSLIKLEKEKSERFGYGLEQTVDFYEEALPPIVKLLTRFNDLERRLTILNKPLDIMLKNEILIRTGVISRDINEKWRLPETQSAAATEQDNIDTVEENEGIKEEKEDDSDGDSVCIE